MLNLYELGSEHFILKRFIKSFTNQANEQSIALKFRAKIFRWWKQIEKVTEASIHHWSWERPIILLHGHVNTDWYYTCHLKDWLAYFSKSNLVRGIKWVSRIIRAQASSWFYDETLCCRRQDQRLQGLFLRQGCQIVQLERWSSWSYSGIKQRLRR